MRRLEPERVQRKARLKNKAENKIENKGRFIMSYRALMLTENKDGKVEGAVTTVTDADLPQDGDVVVDVEYSNLNYKDGMIMNGLGKLVREYPHIPGVDMAGAVVSSEDDRYKPGDQVIVTGWRFGEIWWGGYAERVRVKADWIVPLPKGVTSREAMILGTAGITAVQAIMRLEDQGLAPEKGEVLVTGAAGGVGSLAVAMLANRGYKVAAVTGRPEAAKYLTSLGAAKIVPREDLSEPAGRPMESAIWAGCIDNVGGSTLSRVIGQMAYGGSIASIGNTAGIKLETTVLPFLLRAVNILGIDSVMASYEQRIVYWDNAVKWMPMDRIDHIVSEAKLEDMIGHAGAILKGQIQGRVLVTPKA
jgi:acrylyl-CoA reductase (NADPH)